MSYALMGDLYDNNNFSVPLNGLLMDQEKMSSFPHIKGFPVNSL